MKHKQYGLAHGARWALCISVSQIVGGRTPLCGCGQPAALLIANGADPDDEPFCAQHGLEMLTSMAGTLERIFGKQLDLVSA